MLTQINRSINGIENQFAAFRKGVIAAICDLMILDERRIPAQFGGGIVCRDDNRRMSYTGEDGHFVFSAPTGGGLYEMREALVAHLWATHIGLPSKAKRKVGKVCPTCGQEFYPVGKQKYCTHSCYVNGWARRKYHNRKAVANV